MERNEHPDTIQYFNFLIFFLTLSKLEMQIRINLLIYII